MAEGKSYSEKTKVFMASILDGDGDTVILQHCTRPISPKTVEGRALIEDLNKVRAELGLKGPWAWERDLSAFDGQKTFCVIEGNNGLWDRTNIKSIKGFEYKSPATRANASRSFNTPRTSTDKVVSGATGFTPKPSKTAKKSKNADATPISMADPEAATG